MLAQHSLDLGVGLADRCQVGLGLDDEIGGAEPAERERVGKVGELEGKRKIIRHSGPS